MRPSVLASLLACLITASFAAEEPAAPAPGPAAPPRRPRAVSPDTAAKLTAGLPKYVAKKPAGETAAPPDQPRNGIIRLPNYEVLEKRMPLFREREMLTPKGRVAVAYKRHPGLRLDPLWFLKLNAGPALQMLEEEQKLERAAEMNEALSYLAFVDSLPRDAAAPAPPR